MNRDDLLRMLDLHGKEAKPPPTDEGDGLDIMPAEAPPPAASSSPTALALDEWGLRRGREVLAESARIQRLALGAEAVADFHGAAFEPEPTLLPGCVDPCRHEFVRQLLQTPEYHALHAATSLDEAASAIAAAAFGEQFTRLKKELGEDDDAREDREDDDGEKAEAGAKAEAVKEEAPGKKADAAGEGPAREAGAGKEEGATRRPGSGTEAETARKPTAAREAPFRARPAAPAGGLGRDMATLRSVGRALLRAGAEVAEMHEAAAALGMGPGTPGSNDPRKIAALFRRAWTTWSASPSAATSASCCRRSWRGWPSPTARTTCCAG
jgi:hypothetical protein